MGMVGLEVLQQRSGMVHPPGGRGRQALPAPAHHQRLTELPPGHFGKSGDVLSLSSFKPPATPQMNTTTRIKFQGLPNEPSATVHSE